MFFQQKKKHSRLLAMKKMSKRRIMDSRQTAHVLAEKELLCGYFFLKKR